MLPASNQDTLFCAEHPRLLQVNPGTLLSDRRGEYESPHVSGQAARLRINSLLNRLADARYEPFREEVVKMILLSVWRERPDVKRIRATFGSVSPPSMGDFEHPFPIRPW